MPFVELIAISTNEEGALHSLRVPLASVLTAGCKSPSPTLRLVGRCTGLGGTMLLREHLWREGEQPRVKGMDEMDSNACKDSKVSGEAILAVIQSSGS